MALQGNLTTRAKLTATAVAVGGTAAVVGLGTFGAWTSTTAAETPTYSSGTVTLDFGGATATNRLSVGATDVAPGDTMERGFTLRNSGSLNFASVSLDLAATSSSSLDTDATNGLTVKIDKCSAGWVESASTPYTYTCPVPTTTVLAKTPVATVKASPPELSGLDSLATGVSDSLRATFALPAAANNTTQGKTSTLAVKFTAMQRTGTTK